ncbi:MAG TPA: cyclic nucleotide-binding domain-containing protein [Acidimicrobiales bacterium]|nr:cyclic nucleotide-binding domain-containing protein [Acidimicrobiales bacterium]
MGKARRQPGDTERTFAAGDVILRRGDEGTEMFVIRAGEVDIRRDGVMARLGPGEFFGEMSLLESLPRDADVVAVSDVHLLVLTQGGLLFRLRRDPTFALEMLHRLSGRIRTLNARP